jgi:hypothetical protein
VSISWPRAARGSSSSTKNASLPLGQRAHFPPVTRLVGLVQRQGHREDGPFPVLALHGNGAPVVPSRCRIPRTVRARFPLPGPWS